MTNIARSRSDLVLQARPHELAVIGSILIDNTALGHASFLCPLDFGCDLARWAFEAAGRLQTRGMAIDPLTLSTEILARHGQETSEADLARFFSECETHTPSALHVHTYAARVKEHARRWQVFDLGHRLATAALSANGQFDEWIGLAASSLNALAEPVAAQAHPGESTTWALMETVVGPIEWAWERWLPKGLMTLVASEAGTGKSALMLRLAGCFLCGWDWPDGTPYRGDTGAVLWCEAEAAQAINLERAKAWGLPTERILTPLGDPLTDVVLDDPAHKEAITRLAREKECRLVILDSLRGAQRGQEKDSRDMARVGRWLAELARDTGKPVLVSHHLRKRGILDAGDLVTLDRVRGDTSIVQFARTVWALDMPDMAHPENKRLYVIKSNVGRYPDKVGLTIGDDGLRFGTAPEAPKSATLKDQAVDLLLALLRDGPKPADELQNEIVGAGLSWSAAKRAKTALGIVSIRAGGKNGCWNWALPGDQDAEK